jgi:hypothetical protein
MMKLSRLALQWLSGQASCRFPAPCRLQFRRLDQHKLTSRVVSPRRRQALAIPLSAFMLFSGRLGYYTDRREEPWPDKSIGYISICANEPYTTISNITPIHISD